MHATHNPGLKQLYRFQLYSVLVLIFKATHTLAQATLSSMRLLAALHHITNISAHLQNVHAQTSLPHGHYLHLFCATFLLMTHSDFVSSLLNKITVEIYRFIVVMQVGRHGSFEIKCATALGGFKNGACLLLRFHLRWTWILINMKEEAGSKALPLLASACSTLWRIYGLLFTLTFL